MRNFTLLVILLNLAYLVWNAGTSFGEKSEDVAAAREAGEEAEQSLQLLSELEPESLILINEVNQAVEEQLEEPAEVSVEEITEQGIEESNVELAISLEQIIPSVDTLQCLSIGSFTSAEASDNAVLELTELGYKPDVSIIDLRADPDFWVHMPPFNSMAAARQQLEELQGKNIDSYIITEAEGELSQGISLGLFGEIERALLLQSQLAEEGYPSSIYEVERRNREIWVEINGLIELDLGEVRGLESINSQSELKLEEKLCETIAPEG